jgi:hypothetical protein
MPRLAVVGMSLLLLAATAVGSLKLVQTKENVVSSRMEGSWVADEALWGRMQPYGKAQMTVTFRRDDSVAAKVPQKFLDKLGDTEAYSAGVATMDGKDWPYVLITHDGNPTLLAFRERNGDPMGDAESSLMMLAPAKDPANDILFMGGDFNNEPFRPLKRAAK